MPVVMLGEIARRLGGRLVGPDRAVTRVMPLESAGETDLSFLANPRYVGQLAGCRAAGVLVEPGVEAPHLSLVVVDRPYVALAKVLSLFDSRPRPVPGVDPRSALAKDCVLGKDVSVGPFVTAGPGCRIGDRAALMPGVTLGQGVELQEDVVLYPLVTIYDGCVVGARSVIHAGTVVGSDGFGYAEEGERRLKIPQLGNVVIEEDVEIGANVTVDRATLGSTRIRKGTKIDNLVQVGHNCDVGENSVLVAQVGLSGSVRVGKGVIFAGQSGSVGHVEIGDGSRIGAKSAVTGDLPAGSFVIGHPARDHKEWKRSQATLARLPELRKRISRIERRLEALDGGKESKED
jgi:UDP-3-O-[3-hydroxymyristoyl] glucosamine N-acyltransferase